jgi:hypothetical protein
MKGGGFIVFLFLLFCFLWGVAVVMGGISRWVQSWGTPKPQPEPPEPQTQMSPRATPRTAGPYAAQLHQPLVIDVTPTPTSPSNHPKPTSDAMATTLASLREASELHRTGVLSDAEFGKIKAQLLAGYKS